ncbi:TPA: DUF6261 family protein [Streptococcus suis]
MKTKTNLNIQRLTQAEFTQFMTSTIDTLKEHRKEDSDVFIQQLMDLLVDELPELKRSLKPKRGSDLTKDFQQQLQIRNSDYRAFVAGVKAYKHTRNPEKAKAYNSLSNLCQRYRCSAQTNQQESFALIESLLDKLNEPTYQEDLILLNLVEPLSFLTESNTKAYQLFFQRSQESGSKVFVDSKKIRQSMQRHYRLLYLHLVNQVTFNPAVPEYSLLLALNDIRQSFAKSTRVNKYAPTIESGADSPAA